MASTRIAEATAQEIALVREFNRFYTRQIGVLQGGLLSSPYSLTEVRVMFEISQRGSTTASELASILGLDHGYLSRLLQHLQSLKLLGKKRSSSDGRQLLLTLTNKGQKAYEALDLRASSEIQLLLKDFSAEEIQKLLASMDTIRDLLSPKKDEPCAYVLRPPKPGDYGWIVAAHGDLYAREYGWNEEIEMLAAEIVAGFMKNFDPKYDRCWIAERQGSPVGCVFVAKESQTVAKLRLLLVTSRARGFGIGSRLIDECVRFAKQAGYQKLTLWTQSNLKDARKLYEKAGFQLVHEQAHHSFGHDLVGEHWEMRLT